MLNAISGSYLDDLLPSGLLYGDPQPFWYSAGSHGRRRISDAFKRDAIDKRLPSWSWTGWHGEPLFRIDATRDGRGSYEVGYTETVTQWLALKHLGSTQSKWTYLRRVSREMRSLVPWQTHGLIRRSSYQTWSIESYRILYMSLTLCQMKYQSKFAVVLKFQLISITQFQSGILESGNRPTAGKHLAKEEESVEQKVRHKGMEKEFEQMPSIEKWDITMKEKQDCYLVLCWVRGLHERDRLAEPGKISVTLRANISG